MCSKFFTFRKIFNSNNTFYNYNNNRIIRLFSYNVGRRLNRLKLENNETLLQEELLSTALENGKIPNDWLSLKTSVLSQGKIINEINFDAKAIGFCILHKNYEAAKTLLQFHEEKNETLNIGALGKFMKLYYDCYEKLGNKDEEIILKLYKNIKENNSILSSITIENIIPALSVTKEWEKCLELLENLTIAARPSTGIYSIIIKAAFENDNLDLGWKLIQEMIGQNKFPNPSVYNSWLKKSNDIEFLLKFFGDNEILPPKDVLDNVLQKLPQHYSKNFTSLTKTGICKNCNQSLAKINISDAEFNKLKSVFMENVIIGKNVFTKTDPQELNRFQLFLKQNTFDIVIDGLNVAYSAGSKKNPLIYSQILANVVRHYKLKSSKILVLGRLHMNKWPHKYMGYVNSNAQVFLTKNLSQDDPFLLYAAMSNGLGTSFLSRDLMRGHMYLLMDVSLKRIFRKWQQLHQHSLIYAENNGQVHIKPPFPILCTAQENQNSWHIPFVEKYENNPPMSFEPPKNWCCIQKNKQ